MIDKPTLAHAIFHFGKAIENRSWATAHRCPLAIHAGKSLAEYALGLDFDRRMSGLPPPADLVYGAIVGVVDVVDCVPYVEAKDRPFAERIGPVSYCWLLEDARAVEPISWRGRLGLFDVPEVSIQAARKLSG